MRVLLDVNIFISYLLTPNLHGTVYSIIKAAFAGRFVLILPTDVIEELMSVASQRHIKRRISKKDMKEFIDQISVVCELAPRISESIPAVTRDPKDDYLLAHALVSEADYLVTGDKDLLVLKKVGRLRIVSPSEFNFSC